MFVSSWQKRRRLPGADKRPGDDDDGGDYGGDDHGGDDHDDIYIMMKCLSVCLSVTKNHHFHYRSVNNERIFF